MDIFNRPPAIAEDTLEYVLHPGSKFPDKSSVTTLAAVVDLHVSSVLSSHIWHKDAFELKVVSAPKNANKWIIEGRMRVGDCVDDEWCVVWLLRDISQRWDVAVSVFDSDGDFLLIEAAEYLPGWVTPTNSENRVWIYQGHLHLVPLQYVSSPNTNRERRNLPGRSGSDDEGAEDTEGDDGYISVSDAIQVVRNPAVDTSASSEVESAAMRRIQGYPALAHQHLHRTKAYLPRDIVIALSNNPALVQKATEAFYTRDAIQLRAATRMTRFSPSSSILSTVTMTRAAYAQLVGQKFHPPKVFGQWKEREGTTEWRRKDVGMKIACGFEMLFQESKSRHDVTTSQMDGGEALVEARKDALRRDAEYITYINKLQDFGYFKNEVKDSTAWKEQENRAATQFLSARKIDNANRPSFASMVSMAISRGESAMSRLLDGDEDPEEWLTVDEGTLDGILANSMVSKNSAVHGGNAMEVDEKDKGETSEDRVATEQGRQLRNLAEKVGKFVDGKGDVEGATFEDDLLSEDDDMSNLTDSDDESMSESQDVDVIHSADAERQAAMDKLVPALEPSEYGKMPPSFHSNSQKVKEVTIEPETIPLEEPLDQPASAEPKPIRPLIFPRDRFDGVEDSDDESEDEDVGGNDDEDDEDQPTLVGEVEVDMQQEEEEFLEFSREALGITPEMWNSIVQDRKGRGAFLPSSALNQGTEQTQIDHASSPQHSQVAADSQQQNPDSGRYSNTNPNLDSFEAVMQAMDAELSRAKRDKKAADAKTVPTRPLEQHKESEGKGKQKANEDDEDVETAMDAELQAALQDVSDDDIQEGAEASMDYTLIKNFLESFKGQNGLSGPVGNLVGRLQPGWKLPRDES